MSIIETDHDPCSRERKALALALCALGGVMAIIVWYKPATLMFVSFASALAWCASMVFNTDEPRRRQLLGLVNPVATGLLYAAVQSLDARGPIAVTVSFAFIAIGIVVWLRDRFGIKFYRTWTLMFMPLAWSISTALLILIYYGVLTPIALMLRTAGRDRLGMNFDRDRTTYWIKRDAVPDPERYFRQF